MIDKRGTKDTYLKSNEQSYKELDDLYMGNNFENTIFLVTESFSSDTI